MCVFFFQAEDGIRDLTVTGVRRVLFRSVEFEVRKAVSGGVRYAYEAIDSPRESIVMIRDETFFGTVLNDDGLVDRSEEHTSELQSQSNLVCRLLLEKKKNTTT